MEILSEHFESSKRYTIANKSIEANNNAVM